MGWPRTTALVEMRVEVRVRTGARSRVLLLVEGSTTTVWPRLRMGLRLELWVGLRLEVVVMRVGLRLEVVVM